MQPSHQPGYPLSAADSGKAAVLPETLNAEIIAVGTELLMGEVVNTNAAYLSDELARVGVNVYFHTTVGDNPNRLKQVFRQALERSHLVLVTGGLGPTDDDLTVATLADLLDAPLVRDGDSEEQIRRFFIARDMPMSRLNLKQALRPEDGEPLPNRMGTAPGLFWDVTQRVRQLGWSAGPGVILAFPGVPREMEVMWTEEALPRIKALLPGRSVLVTRYLKFFGIGESKLGEQLRDLMAQASPTVSPYVGQADVKIRIAVRAGSQAEGMALIEPVEADILSRVGQYCYGRDDDQLEGVVGHLLRESGRTLGVAESCTGGLVSSRLTDISGSSDYTMMNVVTYSNEAKERVLGVSPEALMQYGAVSPQVAAQMAEGIVRVAQTDVGLAVTGIAGPTGGTPEKPVGLAYIGLAGRECPTVVKKVTVNPQYTREYIKFWFSQYALNLCRLYLEGLLYPDQD